MILVLSGTAQVLRCEGTLPAPSSNADKKEKAAMMAGMIMLAIFQTAGSLLLRRFAGIALGSWS